MKYGKGLSKYLSAVLSAAVLVSSFSAVVLPVKVDAAVVAPQDKTVFTQSAIKYFDFENGNGVSHQNSSLADSGSEMHGGVYKQGVSDGGVKYSVLSLTDAEREKLMQSKDGYVISFDFMAKQTDHIYHILFRDYYFDGGNKKNLDETYIYLDHGGKVIANKNGQGSGWIENVIAKNATYNTSGYKEIGTYKANTWHNITIAVYPNNGGTNVKFVWYYDGEMAMEGDLSTPYSKAYVNATGYIQEIYIGSTKTGMQLKDGEPKLTYDGTEELNIDNLTFSTFCGDTFGASASGYKKNINVAFTEALSTDADFSDVKIRNLETGDYVSVAGVTKDKSSVLIKTNEDLSASTEYAISFNQNVKSAMGKSVDGDVYFVSDSASGLARDNLVFDSGTTVYEKTASISDSTLSVPLTLTGGNNDDEYIVDMDYTVTNPGPSAAKTYLKNANGNNLGVVHKTNNEDGQIVVWKATYGEMDIGLDNSVGNPSSDWWTGGFFFINNAFPSGTKRKVTYHIKADTRKTTIYLNDEKTCEIPTAIDAGKSLKPAEIRVGLGAISGGNLNTNETVRIENVKVYTANNSKKPTKLRVVNKNGSQSSAYTNTTNANATNAKVYFNCDVMPDTLTTSTILINDSNGGPVLYTVDGYDPDEGCANISFNAYLIPGETYTVSVNGVKDSLGLSIGSYTTEFTVSDKKDFYLSNLKLIKGSELTSPAVSGDVSFDADVVNFTDDAKKVNVILYAEKNGEIRAQKQVEITSASVGYDVLLSSLPSDLKINVDSPDFIKAIIVDPTTNMPYTTEVSVGTRTVSDEANRDSYYNKFEKTYSEKKNTRFFAKVYLPKTTEEGTDGAPVAYVTDKSDETGKITVDFRIKTTDKSGKYKVVGSFEDGTQIDGYINVANEEEARVLTTDICNSVQTKTKEEAISDIKNSVEQNVYALGIPIEDVSNLNTTQIATIIYNEINAMPGKTTDAPTMQAICAKAACIEGIKSGVIQNLYDYSDVLKLETTRINQFKDYSFNNQTFKTQLTNKIKNAKRIDNFADFEGVLYEQFVLCTVKAPDGTENLKAVMNEFNEEIGIEKNLSSDHYVGIQHKDYASYQSLKEAIGKINPDGGSNLGDNGHTTSSPGLSGGLGGNISVPSQWNAAGNAPEINKNIFDDIEDVDWAKDAIIYLAEKKIINGVGDGKFAPNDGVTRAEMAKMLVNSFIDSDVSGDNPFSDVDDSHWAKEYILKAYAAGVISGFEDGTFRPDEKITRQDAVVMMYRAAKNFGIVFYADIENNFADNGDIAYYAKEAVENMYNMGYVNGVGGGRFAPNDTTTRAETAKIIYEIFQK